MVLDTNLLISALLSPESLPAELLAKWDSGGFALLSCVEQVEELRRASRYSKIAGRIPRPVVGRLINELRKVAEFHPRLPAIDASLDPFDNYLLALAQVGRADFLVTGDKAGLLSLGIFERTRIVTARQFLEGQ